MKRIVQTICIFFLGLSFLQGSQKPKLLDQTNAENFVQLALKCLQKEFPNKLDHVINGPEEVLSPRALHPAFYGCFDWHSAVHGTWLVVRCLNLFPEIKQREQILLVIKENLSAANLAAELEYFKQQNRQTFERPYGWAWFLKLCIEIRHSSRPEIAELLPWLEPLEKLIVEKYINYFQKLTYPIRTGVHPNSAFALTFLYDYGLAIKNDRIQQFVKDTAYRFFFKDSTSGAFLEPGGEDFFSPALLEAELMARILPPEEFEKWFNRFFFDKNKSFNAENLLQPAIVSDRSDAKIVHLDGLNFSRSWCLSNIARSLPANHSLKKKFRQAAEKLFRFSFEHINSGDYGGEHWLASFALNALQVLE